MIFGVMQKCGVVVASERNAYRNLSFFHNIDIKYSFQFVSSMIGIRYNVAILHSTETKEYKKQHKTNCETPLTNAKKKTRASFTPVFYGAKYSVNSIEMC